MVSDMTHKDWCTEVAHETQKCVLRKIEKILKEEDELYSNDLDNLKDCWKIMYYIHQMMHSDTSSVSGGVVHSHEHTHVTP